MDTIFTKIIRREIPAHIVYEDDVVLAFLDIHPIRKGHTLIIPKHPYVDIFDMTPEAFCHVAQVAQKIAHSLISVTGAHGVNIHMNNGEVAGQDIFHAHMHVIPRFEREEAFVHNVHEAYGENEAVLLAEKLATELQK